MLVRLWSAVATAVCASSAACASSTPGTPATVDTCVHTTTSDPLRRDSDTLPTGTCASNSACDLIVRQPCACPNVQLPRLFFHCSCSSKGEWVCEDMGDDLGVCFCSDAGD
jgi:hypothetical protein